MTLVADYPGLDAGAVARLVQKRELSPVETVEAALDAVARLDGRLNAIPTLAADSARAAARDLEARILRGEAAGPLAGVPVVIKDLVLTRGIRTTFGSRLYADYVPAEDDIAVARLKAAGAIVIGKGNAAELGYGGFGHNPVFPTTRNPWDLELTPGGSSAGSAAAVAAGIVPMALGSDGGGSVRLPAAFTGIVGMKPTMGRIPVWPGCRDETLPGVSGWESIEHYGPLTRTVADATLFLAATIGPDRRDRWSLPDEVGEWASVQPFPSGLRIAFCPTWGDTPVEPEVATVVAAAARCFASDLGAEVSETASPFADIVDANRAIVAMETDLTGLRRLAAGREEALSPGLRGLLARAFTAEQFTDAITARKGAVNAMARFMARHDLILTPTAPLAAFPIDRDGPGSIAGRTVADDAWSPCLYPANLTGQPAISVPAGFTRAGLPVGLQIIGDRLADRLVLAAAAAFAAARPFAERRPPNFA